jgi:endonuclease YncB( thermonuclease family)
MTPSRAPGPTDYLVLTGSAVLVGKQPDGDSVRFAADDPDLFGRLDHGDRVRLSADGTVQLRFDGIDAPELHYSGTAQPQGAAARDALLAHLGFSDVTYRSGSTTVTAAEPATLPIVVLSRLVEVNGRPVSVVFAGTPAERLAGAGGTWVELDTDLLDASVNAWEVTTGVAYPLLYTSTAPDLRAAFTAMASTAAEQRLGVWAADSSARFSVADPEDVGPDGALILPKLFRRTVDYLRDRSDPRLTLPQWLAARPDTEDDDVVVADAPAVPLHTLLAQDGDTVTFSPGLLDLVFVER